MSAKERVRLDAMHRIERNEITVVSAAELMCVSLRQARRLWKRYRQQGAAGLIHRSRGRASNQTYARFYSAETTLAAMDVLGRWVKKHGVPRSVYVDRHSIYRDEGHPEKPTQFGRAMKELQVALICAGSPQAKGRVERRHRVFQERLVKEMRLRPVVVNRRVWKPGADHPWKKDGVGRAAGLRPRSGLRPSLRMRRPAPAPGHRCQGDISKSANKGIFLILYNTAIRDGRT